MRIASLSTILRFLISAGCGVVACATVCRAGVISPPSSLYYSTSATIGGQGVQGSNVVSFVGLGQSSFFDAGAGNRPAPVPIDGPNQGPAVWDFQLGNFVVSPVANGSTTTYQHTPFTLTLSIEGVANIKFTGTLDGQVDGAGKSSLQATYDGDFQAGNATVPANSGLFQFTANGLNFGLTPLTGVHGLGSAIDFDGGVSPTEGTLLVSQPVPEPASIAVFLGVMGATAIGRGLRSLRAGIAAERRRL